MDTKETEREETVDEWRDKEMSRLEIAFINTDDEEERMLIVRQYRWVRSY